MIALDEAFAAAHPSLARELSEGPGWGYGSVKVPIKLGDPAGKVLAELEAARAEGRGPVALVTSPLVAAALPGPWRDGGEASCLGDALLLIPERRRSGRLEARPTTPSEARRPFAEARSDPIPAYAAAGKAAGAYIASLQAKGEGTPACGILFLEAPARPRAVLQAFVDAFSAASGGGWPLVRELTADDDEEKQAEAAVQELLGADLRILFVALGGGSPAAIRAASRLDIVVGADFEARAVPANLAFRIRPDDAGLAEALWAALPAGRRAGGGTADPAAGREASPADVPSILEALPGAAGTAKRAFLPFLKQAGNR